MKARKTNKRFWLLTTLLAFTVLRFVQAATLVDCRVALGMVQLKKSALLAFDSPATHRGAGQTTEQVLSHAKKQLPENDYKQFVEWYLDQFFLSRTDALLDNISSRANRIERVNRYEVSGESPFSGYITARKYLYRVPFSKMSVNDMAEMHENLMSWKSNPKSKGLLGWLLRANSEHTDTADLGKIREVSVIFQVQREDIDLDKLPRITTGDTPASSPDHHELIAGTNPFLSYRPGGGARFAFVDEFQRSLVYYTPLSGWRKLRDRLPAELIKELEAAEAEYGYHGEAQHEAMIAAAKANILAEGAEKVAKKKEILLHHLRLKKLTRAEYLKEVQAAEEAQEQFNHQDTRNIERDAEERRLAIDKPSEAHNKPLRQKYVTALLEGAWLTMKSRLAKAKTKNEILEVAADFYYDFVSIHPFINGNGRSGRLIVERVLAEFNLPPPIFTYTDIDITFSREDFRGYFKDAVALSVQLQTNLKALHEHGVPSMQVALPYLAGHVDKNTFTGAQSPEDFMSWVAATRLRDKPEGVADAVREYKEWKPRANYQGSQTEGVRLTTPFFTATLGRLSPLKSDYDFKLANYYDPTPIYRVLRLEKVPSDRELLKRFSQLQEFPEHQQKADVFATYNENVVRAPGRVATKLYRATHNPDEAWRKFYRTPKEARENPVGVFDGVLIEIRTKSRVVGSFDGARKTEMINPGFKDGTPKPFLVLGGYDPESIEQISVKGTKVTRTAERSTWNRVRITDTDSNGKVVRSLLYEIGRDGGTKLVPAEGKELRPVNAAAE